MLLFNLTLSEDQILKIFKGESTANFLLKYIKSPHYSRLFKITNTLFKIPSLLQKTQWMKKCCLRQNKRQINQEKNNYKHHHKKFLKGNPRCVTYWSETTGFMMAKQLSPNISSKATLKSLHIERTSTSNHNIIETGLWDTTPQLHHGVLWWYALSTR